MEEQFANGVADVFSILPGNAAQVATLDTLTRLDGGPGDSLDIVWAEFDGARRLLRGGVTAWPGGTRFYHPSNVPHVMEALQAAGTEARLGDVRQMPEGGGFYWFAPCSEPLQRRKGSGGLKGFAVDEALFTRLVACIEDSARLTAAESRLFFQVASGLSAGKAAEQDGVSIETKRTQMKWLYTKLGCDGLADLVRRAAGCLSHLVRLCEADVREAATIETFVSRHLDRDTRLSLQRMPSGRLLRFLELGAPDGRPLLVMHGMLFPILLIGAAPHLAAAGLRLIVPIRQGYLDTAPAAGLRPGGSPTSASLHDIATFAQASLPTPVTVLGHSNGAAIALRFARLYPEVVERLVLLSMNAGGLHDQRNSFSHRFFTGLQRLALESNVFGLLSWQFNRFYGDRAFVKTVLRGLFGGCADDWQLLEGSGERPSAYGWFSEGYLSSSIGVAEDFRVVMDEWRADLAAVRAPLHFIHGLRDTLVGIGRIRDLHQALSGTRLDTVDGGHLVCATHAALVWRAVASSMRSSSLKTPPPAAT